MIGESSDLKDSPNSFGKGKNGKKKRKEAGEANQQTIQQNKSLDPCG
jgi:hypothetical protein